jgi:hypothetical protein
VTDEDSVLDAPPDQNWDLHPWGFAYIDDYYVRGTSPLPPPPANFVHLPARWISGGGTDDWFDVRSLSEVAVALAPTLTIFFKAFVETLAKRSADYLAGAPKRLRCRWGERLGNPEVHIGPERSDIACTLVITSDLSDEARLALLDLDVTAERLRGKLLHWDDGAIAWVPEGDQER